MPGRFDEELTTHLETLNQDLDDALRRTMELHRSGADEEAVLAETSLAFRAARSLEALTGVAWEERLEAKVDPDVAIPLYPSAESEATKRRWRRKRAGTATRSQPV